MSEDEELTDLSWPKEFADFKTIDTVLKCGICYEFMINSTMTICSHSYCSICIRRYLQYKNVCPSCFKPVYDSDLRVNRSVNDILRVYSKSRENLIRTLKHTEKLSNETKIELEDLSKVTTVPSDDVEKTVTKLSPHKNENKLDLNGVKIPAIFNPLTASKTKFATCPVCNVEVPAKNINLHLDSCLNSEIDSNKPKSKEADRRKTLPKRLYQFMTDKVLRNHLQKLGLDIRGDRKTLLTRIHRYTVIYNAETDAPNPRPVNELIKQLQREENILKSNMEKIVNKPVPVPKISPVKYFENMNKEYRDLNKQSFKNLIESVRKRENRKPAVSFNPNVPSTSTTTWEDEEQDEEILYCDDENVDDVEVDEGELNDDADEDDDSLYVYNRDVFDETFTKFSNPEQISFKPLVYDEDIKKIVRVSNNSCHEFNSIHETTTKCTKRKRLVDLKNSSPSLDVGTSQSESSKSGKKSPANKEEINLSPPTLRSSRKKIKKELSPEV